MAEQISQPIRHRAYIAAPIEQVFNTISRGEGWNAFFTSGTDMEPKAGTRCVWRWNNWGPDKVSAESVGEVLEVAPPQRFVFTWEMKPTTTIEFELSRRGDGTVVEVRHHGFEATERGMDQILDCASGWGEAVTMLKYFLEHGARYTPAE